MYCATPLASPITAVVFYFSLITLGSFGILSSIIGIIDNSMGQSISATNEMKRKQGREAVNALAAQKIESLKSGSKYSSRVAAESLDVIERVLGGKSFHKKTHVDVFVRGAVPKTFYWYRCHFSHRCAQLAQTSMFENTITFVILMTAVSAGMETSASTSPKAIATLNNFIQNMFVIDLLVRWMAEVYPWFFFEENWNKFDFMIVLISYVPLNFNLVVIRMLRLLRLLKLMRRFPTLQIIMVSLTNSVNAIVLITSIMFIIITILGGVGVLLFAENDPLHFIDIRAAFVALFQVMTLDGWGNLLWINLFGCDQTYYPGTPLEYMCVSSKPNFVAAAIFYPLVVASLCWVMMTMFIGLMTASMSEALLQSKTNIFVDSEVDAIKKERRISTFFVHKLDVAFRFLDFSEKGVLGRAEVQFAIEHAGLKIDPVEFRKVWDKKDIGEPLIDFSQFLVIAIDLRHIGTARRMKKKMKRSASGRWVSDHSLISTDELSLENQVVCDVDGDEYIAVGTSEGSPSAPSQREGEGEREVVTGSIAIEEDMMSILSLNSLLFPRKTDVKTGTAPAPAPAPAPDNMWSWASLGNIVADWQSGGQQAEYKEVVPETPLPIVIEEKPPIRFNDDTGSVASIRTGVSIQRRRYTKEEQLEMKAFLEQKMAEAVPTTQTKPKFKFTVARKSVEGSSKSNVL